MPQHITATITLAGDEPVTIDAHGTENAEGSHLTVALPGALLWLYDQATVRVWSSPWRIGLAPVYAQNLPTRRALKVPTGSHPITLGVQPSHADLVRVDFDLRRLAVMLHFGPVTLAVLDRRAWDHQVATWQRVTQLAELILPTKPRPR